jgi:peptidoglycan biosynthesis protein MviN/MurJ (putative lipid II flippase)
MPRSGSVVSNAAITSASQAATMVSGGALAVLVAATIGNDARTDGFFAAFGVYSLLVSFAQSSRTTIVARLLEGRERFDAFNRYLGAGILIFLLVSLAFGPLGDVVARILTGNPTARETARTALLVLWPAAGLQLFAALGAAMLGALGDFLWAGLAFVGGSILSIVAFVALRPSLGIDGLAVAMLIGSVLSALIILAALLREGWRPSRSTVTEPREAVRGLSVLAISSLSFLIAQLGFVVTLGVAARLGVGTVTVVTYSYMAMALVQAVFVSSIPMVLAAPIAQTWDRRAQSLLPHNEAVFAAGLLLVVPVVATVALIGVELGEFVLADFTHDEVHLVIELFLILSANVVWGLAATVPYAAAVAVGRYALIAAATAAVVAVDVGLSLLAGAVNSVELLAAATPISTLAATLTTMAIAAREYPRLAVPRLAAILARLLAAGAFAFGVPLALGRAAGLPGANWVAVAVGLPLFAVIVFKLLPAEGRIAERLAAALPWARVRAEPSG